MQGGTGDLSGEGQEMPLNHGNNVDLVLPDDLYIDYHGFLDQQDQDTALGEEDISIDEIIQLATQEDDAGIKNLLEKFSLEGPLGNKLFPAVQAHVKILIVHETGKALVNFLFEKADQEQRTLLLHAVGQDIANICSCETGATAVQQIIQNMRTHEDWLSLKAALEPQARRLIISRFGNWVIQYYIRSSANIYRQFLFAYVGYNCFTVGTNPYGSYVLRTCLETSRGIDRDYLVSCVCNWALPFSQMDYGKRVLVFLLDMRIPSAGIALALKLRTHYANLTRERFGHVVVKKCLEVFEGEGRNSIVNEILCYPDFQALLMNDNSKVVILSALRILPPLEVTYTRLLAAIHAHKGLLRTDATSRSIADFLEN